MPNQMTGNVILKELELKYNNKLINSRRKSIGKKCMSCSIMNFPRFEAYDYKCTSCGKYNSNNSTDKFVECLEELDEKICNELHPDLYNHLTLYFPNIKVLNPFAFVRANDREAAISSVFRVTEGGSCSFTYKGLEFVTYNGSLQKFGNLAVWYYSIRYANLKWMN